MRKRFWILLPCALACGCGGCIGSARVELAAADALDALSAELAKALAEYQSDLDAADDQRESAVIAAFIARTRNDAGDDAVMQAHAEQFAQALAKIRGDRRTAWQRHDASVDNLAAAQEVARELRAIALSGIALQDDARAYLNRLLTVRQQAQIGRMPGSEITDFVMTDADRISGD